MEKGRRNKNLEFLTGLFKYSLKNNFVDAIQYLGANSRHLIPNLSLFVSLNAETKECFVFAHRKVKKSYLSFVLKNIREFASKIGVDLSPSEYSIKTLPDEEFIGDEGLTQPEFTLTVPVFVKDKVVAFLNFSKHGHLSPEEEDITHLNLVVNFLSALQEREEKEKSEKEDIEKLAFVDSLTGVLNRRAFYQIFPQDISEGRRSGAILSLVVLDIDGFKQINDSYGHAFGDMILKQVTSKFKNLLREEDKIFRLGGDEFAVVMKTDKRQAFSAIQRILKEISDNSSPRITLSGGIAEIHSYENINIDDVVRQADKALYLAKEGGKDQALFYENEKLNIKSGELFFDDKLLQFTEDIHLKLKELAVRQLVSLYSYFRREDVYMHEHLIVSNYAVQLGKELNLSEKRLENLKFGAIIYDIGMIAVPEEILFKSTKLTPREYSITKRHTIMGGRIIQRFPILCDVLRAVLYHHEWMNGQGYPFGLSGDSIPIEARIVAVADAFHAMRSNRSYRPALSREKSISEIINSRGTKYDPQVVEALLSLVEKRLVA